MNKADRIRKAQQSPYWNRAQEIANSVHADASWPESAWMLQVQIVELAESAAAAPSAARQDEAETDSCSHWREGDSDNCLLCGDDLGPTSEVDLKDTAAKPSGAAPDAAEEIRADAIKECIAKVNAIFEGMLSVTMTELVAGLTTLLDEKDASIQ